MKAQFIRELNELFYNLFNTNILSIAYTDSKIPEFTHNSNNIEDETENIKHIDVLSDSIDSIPKIPKLSFDKPKAKTQLQSVSLYEIFKKSIIHIPKKQYKFDYNSSLVKDIASGQYKPLEDSDTFKGQYKPLEDSDTFKGQYKPLEDSDTFKGQYKPLEDSDTFKGQYKPLPDLIENSTNNQSTSKSTKRKSMQISTANMSKIRINNKDYFVPNQKQKIDIFKFMVGKPKLVTNKLNERGTMLIPAYERGTDKPISTPTLAMVGEKGPEHIVPQNKKMSITPINTNSNINSTMIDLDYPDTNSPNVVIPTNIPYGASIFNYIKSSLPIFDGEI